MMQFKEIYSEVLELFLILRQLFSRERFLPFNKAMESLSSSLSDGDALLIEEMGILTNGYLSALSRIIDLLVKSSGVDSDILKSIFSDPSQLFLREDQPVNDERVLDRFADLRDRYFGNPDIKARYAFLLKRIWSSGVCREKANQSLKIIENIESLGRFGTGEAVFDYLQNLSDRLTVEEETVAFRIKPEWRMPVGHIGTILIMPSLFAGRKLTFWHSGGDLLFFISIGGEEDSIAEPSDMQLLYTSALNDRSRLKMLKIIAGADTTAGELAGKLSLNASTVSRHLKLFKDSGFIDIVSNDGRQIVYGINRTGLRKALQSLEDFIIN